MVTTGPRAFVSLDVVHLTQRSPGTKGLRQHQRLEGPDQTALSKQHNKEYKTPNMGLLCPGFLLMHVKQKKLQSSKIIISNHLKSQGEKSLERKVNETKLIQAGQGKKTEKILCKSVLPGKDQDSETVFKCETNCGMASPGESHTFPELLSLITSVRSSSMSTWDRCWGHSSTQSTVPAPSHNLLGETEK